MIKTSSDIFYAGSNDYQTDLAILDILRYCIQHAEQNLPIKLTYLLEVQTLFVFIFPHACSFLGFVDCSTMTLTPKLMIHRCMGVKLSRT
jgi:hypothetical protein